MDAYGILLRLSGQAAADEVLQKIKKTKLWETGKMKIHAIVELPNELLQQSVRGSWLSDPKQSREVRAFVDQVVSPCLRVSLASIPSQLHEVMVQFESIITSGAATDQQLNHIKVASSVIKGDYNDHPLLLGLCLQTSRMLERQSRGLSMKGKIGNALNDEARTLVLDAGLQLACATGNSRLCREFGLGVHSGRFKLEDLAMHSLPEPALAVMFEDVLANNFRLADQRLPRRQGSAKRAFYKMARFSGNTQPPPLQFGEVWVEAGHHLLYVSLCSFIMYLYESL